MRPTLIMAVLFVVQLTAIGELPASSSVLILFEMTLVNDDNLTATIRLVAIWSDTNNINCTWIGMYENWELLVPLPCRPGIGSVAFPTSYQTLPPNGSYTYQLAFTIHTELEGSQTVGVRWETEAAGGAGGGGRRR